MGKTLIQKQIVFFFSKDYIGSFEDFSFKLKKILGESKLSQYIPVPTDAPSDIPRLALIYQDYNVNISKNRIDFFISKNSFDLKILEVSNLITKDLSLQIGRLALVKNFFVESGDISPIKDLLCESKKNLSLKEISIRINQEKIIKDKKCNDIEILSNGVIENKETKEKKSGIVINRDINTLLEDIQNNSFTSDVASEILKEFDLETDKFTLLI